jgi:hypothetical protein
VTTVYHTLKYFLLYNAAVPNRDFLLQNARGLVAHDFWSFFALTSIDRNNRFWEGKLFIPWHFLDSYYHSYSIRWYNDENEAKGIRLTVQCCKI